MSDASNNFYIDRTLYYGKPEDLSDRLEKEIRTYDLLDRLEIPYQRLDHAPLPTIDACREVDSLLNIDICKNLFLCNAKKTEFFLLLLPGKKKFRTACLSKQIGSSRLSFADPEFMIEFLDITPGSVSVLGLMNDKDNKVQLLIDKDVLLSEFFSCHPCINTSSLKMKTADLINQILPAINHSFIQVDLPGESDSIQ
ncbi:prolyl-tRNA synthetase associated domain-containing protein [Clostridium boliviensis]|uniref:Prolyl-tRNA synthetase associated domain-containing protein n=1 Tax=Clostridium boliviensis TaxID=318465 RepID=A0ABU4GV93_9CLOT|nr:prolyl-tRNA synthetase associated domain-containing protein [Clostridium boliviensis]MDW2800917.1 prolyl-tRNA synthetase associated domain-containing protein [Clostridium boliviensis]